MKNAICSCVPPPVGWSVNRQTHPAIAQAIFALSDDERTPEAIWATPTPEEWRKISELVVEYVGDGDFAFDTGKFAWGPFETLHLWPARRDLDRGPAADDQYGGNNGGAKGRGIKPSSSRAN